MAKISTSRLLLIIVSILTLGLVYVFQRFNFLEFTFGLLNVKKAVSPDVIFIVNKSVRMVINDLACLILIKGIFDERSYLKLASFVFLLEICVLLPLYLYLKLTFEGTSEISSPLLSQFHRLIVNPMLMALVIISFFYQRFRGDEL